MSDVLITPASSKIEFKDASDNIDGIIQLDSDGNLELTSPGGGISFGDTASDVYIGNGTDNVDLIFDANGSITGSNGVTLTLGSSDSSLTVASNLTVNGTLTLGSNTINDVEDIYLRDRIYHDGDTDTYIQFHAGNQFRVVTGGTERLEVNNDRVHVRGDFTVNDTPNNLAFEIKADQGTFRVNQNVPGWSSSTSHPILMWDYKAGPGDMMYMSSGGNTPIADQMALVISDGHGFKVGKSGWDGSDADIGTEYFRVNTAGAVNIPGGTLTIDGASTQMLLHPGSNSETVIVRNDSDKFYFLMSNAGTAADGTWNSLRPFYIDISNGMLTSNNGQTFAGGTTFSSSVLIDTDNNANGALRIEANQTNPSNDFYFAQEIVSTLSGSTATGSDREQGGIYMDINSSATGGDTSNEHRAYGIYIDLDSTGDSDLVYGVYSDATATPTTGTTTEIVGVFGRAEDNGGAGNVSNLYGIRGLAVSDNSTSDTNSMYGGYFKAQPAADTGNIGNATGVYAEIEIANNTGDHLDVAYVVRAEFDDNDTNTPEVAQTCTSYLYYGNYAGTRPTDPYGVYIQDDVPNYFGGTVTANNGFTSSSTDSFVSKIDLTSSTQIEFTLNNVEVSRWTVVGTDRQLLIGRTSTTASDSVSGIRLHNQTNNHGRIEVAKTTSGTRDAYVCRHNGSYVGGVSYGNSSTTFATSSDIRLKENIVDLDGAIDRVKQLEPKRFNFKIDPDVTVDGFLAHEVQTVIPEAVLGTYNEVDTDGNPVYQSIDQAKLVPLLTSALKEAITKIEQLEARVAELESN